MHSFADCDDLAHVLVAEHLALFDVRAALVHVQIRSADVRCRDLDKHIGRLLDPGIRHVVDRNVLRAVVDQCAHEVC